MKVTETLYARGHENLRGTNKTTFEITKETHLTKRGDCIVAVGATKGAADLSPDFKKAAQSEKVEITIIFQVDGEIETIRARGSPQLPLTHPTDLVIRKSDYTCSRTLGVHADKAAEDFSRSLIEKMRDPEQKVTVTLTAETTT